jgi:hypothetical protein
MTKGLFIVASRARRSLAEFSCFRNEPRVNGFTGALQQESPRSISEGRRSIHELKQEPADHPVYAMTIVAAIAVVRANASAMAAKIILIVCS